MTHQLVYLNDNYLPLVQAKVSVMDRGFMFGDGVYETVSIYHGKPFRLAEHHQRLGNSLAAIHIDFDFSLEMMSDIVHGLISRNGITSGHHTFYLQITRGEEQERTHDINKTLTPTVYAQCAELAEADGNKGWRAITVPDIRWQRCEIKTISRIANILLLQAAREHDVDEAILIDNGHVIESARSNVFIVEQDKLVTPPLSVRMLGGVTRDLILELAKQHGVTCSEEAIPVARLKAADEVWLTATSKQVAAVVELDGKLIGNGQPGPMQQRFFQYYQDFIVQLA